MPHLFGSFHSLTTQMSLSISQFREICPFQGHSEDDKPIPFTYIRRQGQPQMSLQLSLYSRLKVSWQHYLPPDHHSHFAPGLEPRTIHFLTQSLTDWANTARRNPTSLTWIFCSAAATVCRSGTGWMFKATMSRMTRCPPLCEHVLVPQFQNCLGFYCTRVSKRI